MSNFNTFFKVYYSIFINSIKIYFYPLYKIYICRLKQNVLSLYMWHYYGCVNITGTFNKIYIYITIMLIFHNTFKLLLTKSILASIIGIIL